MGLVFPSGYWNKLLVTTTIDSTKTGSINNVRISLPKMKIRR